MSLGSPSPHPEDKELVDSQEVDAGARGASSTEADDQAKSQDGPCGKPIEQRSMDRYMPDPSLRYTRVRFAGPWTGRGWIPAALVAIPALLVGGGMGLQAWGQAGYWPWILLALGVVAMGIGAWLTRHSWAEVWLRWCLWRGLGVVEVGTDRAVPQPGTKLRYEVHLHARKKLSLRQVRVRLVFWERWLRPQRVPGIGATVYRETKECHDLACDISSPLDLAKDQHAVVRGTLMIPQTRPSEHRRGEAGHLSYVNLTTTVKFSVLCGLEDAQGSAPHLVTFPWQ